MGKLWEALIHAYAFLAVVPIIPFLLVYGIVVIRLGDKQRALRLAMDVSTLFLIGIVATLINELIGPRSHAGLYLIMLFMLLGAGLIGNAQHRLRGHVDGKRLFRAIWRLSFFGMTVLYLLLMLIQLIRFSVSSPV